jgi:hypothetical protein
MEDRTNVPHRFGTPLLFIIGLRLVPLSVCVRTCRFRFESPDRAVEVQQKSGL